MAASSGSNCWRLPSWLRTAHTPSSTSVHLASDVAQVEREQARPPARRTPGAADLPRERATTAPRSPDAVSNAARASCM